MAKFVKNLQLYVKTVLFYCKVADFIINVAIFVYIVMKRLSEYFDLFIGQHISGIVVATSWCSTHFGETRKMLSP